MKANTMFGAVRFLMLALMVDGVVMQAYRQPQTPTRFYEEVRRGDRHSAKIEANREGILLGADIKRRYGVIDQNQQTEIEEIVKSVEISDFRPILYVIPYSNVEADVREATIEERAHPLSLEFVIESLDRQYFDPIEVM